MPSPVHSCSPPVRIHTLRWLPERCSPLFVVTICQAHLIRSDCQARLPASCFPVQMLSLQRRSALRNAEGILRSRSLVLTLAGSCVKRHRWEQGTNRIKNEQEAEWFLSLK